MAAHTSSGGAVLWTLTK